MDNFVIALSRYRRRRYDEAIQLCDKILQANELDQSAWILKCKSLTKKQFLDDLELDEEGVGDMLMDENAVNTLARPGTSLQRPGTQNGQVDEIDFIIQGVRPMTNQGRLMTGFARPTTNRPSTSADQQAVMKTSRQGPRLGTSRPITQGGRYVRLGTASLQAMGGSFIVVDKLDLKKMAKKPVISRALCDYLIYVEHNPKKAFELAAEATTITKYKDWWWKERLGKCYFMLGLYREAEKQFQSSIKDQEMIQTLLELARVHLRFDQPNPALEIYKRGLEKCPYETSFIIATARVYDQMNEPNKAIDFYRQTLAYESSNLEAVASIAAYHFYIDQPEVSLKFYKRLIQLGVQTPEIWNNLGLCCFYDGQYDLFYSCFERALQLADDSNKADIWYNLSHVFINLGDLGTAYQCLKLAICFDNQHAEAYNNLAIIESKRGELDKARNNYQISMQSGAHLYEPAYNNALMAFKQQEYQQSYQILQKALQVYPEHFDSLELKKQIEKILQNI